MPSKITFWKQIRGLLSSIPAAAGLMPTANLGSGTANDTTFLRGDQAYAALQINALSSASYTIGVGTTGTDVNVASSGSTITVHVPSASQTNRGVVTTGNQTFAGTKTFIGLSDAVQIDVTPFATQVNHQQVWRTTAGLAFAWVDFNGRVVMGQGSFVFSSTYDGVMWQGGSYGWTSAGSVNGGSAIDTGLRRDAGAGLVSARNSTTPHDFRVYNTYTNASNYERGSIGYQSNVFTIGSYAAGTGTLRDIRVGVTGNKIGFFGTTAIVKPTTGFAEAAFTVNAGTAVNDDSTFDGYTIRQVVAALRALGLLT